MALQAVPSRAEKIDRFGELCRQEALFAPVLDEKKALKDEIESWFAGADPEKRVRAVGDIYTLDLTARQNERTITDPRKAWRLLCQGVGTEGALARIKIPLSAVDDLIPRSKHELFLTEERTGYRRISVVPNQAVAPKAA